MKKINRPQLKSATRLSASEMNRLRLSQNHTVLTPEQLAKLASSRNKNLDSSGIITHNLF
ncbi:MAG: hypothetical protein K2H08_10570 [Duncaniella sp.]|nr:hypothetical protein [Duncaniella sp.]